MQIYDEAWESVSRRFWKQRYREFALNFLLFSLFHLYAALFLDSLPYMQFHVGYAIVGIYVGWVSMPSVMFLWGAFLLVHLAVLLITGLIERLFRLRVEREMLRAYVEQEADSEKPKRHLPQSEDAMIEDENYADERRTMLR
jgi:hypothetical protein